MSKNKETILIKYIDKKIEDFDYLFMRAMFTKDGIMIEAYDEDADKDVLIRNVEQFTIMRDLE